MKWWLDDMLGHPLRTAYWSVRIARRLGWGWSSLLCLLAAALLHDIGKLTVPRCLLEKPGRLELSERAALRRHTLYARLWLFFAPRSVRRVIRWHHENWDGSGYPDALREADIPVCARIVAVADVFDALTSPRAYKAAWRPAHAVAHILAARGRQFDPRPATALAILFAENLTREARRAADQAGYGGPGLWAGRHP